MSIDWTPLADLIETHDRFLVTTHVRPDGDALGSEVGMAGLLRQKGKDVRVVNASPTPPRYDFLDPDNTLFEHFGTAAGPEALIDREVVVILDLSAWNQLGDMAGAIRDFAGTKKWSSTIMSARTTWEPVFFKDTSAEATGSLVLQAIRRAERYGHARMATGLLTAIAMDTGWFRHSNTKPGTLRAAAELIEAGAPIDTIYRQLFERNTFGRLKLIGETLAGMKTDVDGSSRMRPSRATTCCAPGRFPRTPKTSSISRSACAASTSACSSSNRCGGRQGLLPRARPGLLGSGRPVRRRRSIGPPPVPRSSDPCPTSSRGSFRRSDRF